jgi:hypothetical protein
MLMKHISLIFQLMLISASCSVNHKENLHSTESSKVIIISHAHLPSKILHYNPAELYTPPPIEFTKALISPATKKIIKNLSRKNPNSPKITKTELFYVKIQKEKGKDAILYKANCEPDFTNDKDKTTIFFVLDETGNKIFDWIGWNKAYDCDIYKIDLDKNGDDELIIESDGTGNQATHVIIEIFDLKKGSYENILTRTISEGYDGPYGINVDYYFKKENNNLILHVNTDIVKELIDTVPLRFRYSENLNYSNYIEYAYDGSNYKSITEDFDYRAPFDIMDSIMEY